MKTWQRLKNNPKLWQQYFMREQLIKAIRSFFDTQHFHEVETPTLIGHPPAESYLELFTTTLLDRQKKPTTMYLSTSPEASLKKLLVAGIGNCYSITKSFRNTETGSVTHNPEFTILEWYRVGATYTDIMTDCEQLFLHLLSPKAKLLHQSLALNAGRLLYQGKSIDLSGPWEKVSMKQAFQRWAHINLEEFFDLTTAHTICLSKGYAVTTKNTWEELYNQIFLNEIEPNLGTQKPTILYDFPATIAALAKKKDTDPRYAERFELYIGGLELADCYTELTDPKEQEWRFENEMKEVKRLGKTTYEYDKDLIVALGAGLPPCAGIAVGLDRILMLFTDTKNIADTLFFPLEELL